MGAAALETLQKIKINGFIVTTSFIVSMFQINFIFHYAEHEVFH